MDLQCIDFIKLRNYFVGYRLNHGDNCGRSIAITKLRLFGITEPDVDQIINIINDLGHGILIDDDPVPWYAPQWHAPTTLSSGGSWNGSTITVNNTQLTLTMVNKTKPLKEKNIGTKPKWQPPGPSRSPERGRRNQ